jgi:hypothetical protein
VRTLITWIALTAVAVVVGFGLAWVALFAVNAVLPPFRREDDGTLREFVPAAIAYGTWAITSAGGALWAWRWVRRRQSN